jgi:hypothetical protein
VKQRSRGQFLEQSFWGFPPVSAGFRPAARRKPAAAALAETIDIVDESDAPDCCGRFPPFAPFPPVVLLSQPKGALQAHRVDGHEWWLLSRRQEL